MRFVDNHPVCIHHSETFERKTLYCFNVVSAKFKIHAVINQNIHWKITVGMKHHDSI